MYRQYGFALLRVSLRGSDEPIGMCGLLKRDMLDAPDIGFAFLPQHWSKGYALEAAQAVMDDARERLKLPRVMAIVNAENASSKALLAKLGMRFVRTEPVPGENREVEVWEARSES
jgi:RimJ/RimL family protein N-acetyltransferase